MKITSNGYSGRPLSLSLDCKMSLKRLLLTLTYFFARNVNIFLGPKLNVISYYHFELTSGTG
jgi:hypothetical protein